MKYLVIALLLIVLTCFSCGTTSKIEAAPILEIPKSEPLDTCPDQDIWIYIKHSEFGHGPCTVVVHVPKDSLDADFQNCPAEDTKVLGEGRLGVNTYAGYHVLTLKKGYLNEATNFTTKPPKNIEVPANNVNSWHVKK